MPPYMSFVCYNVHDKWHVTITDVWENFSCKLPFHGLGKSSLVFRGVEKKSKGWARVALQRSSFSTAPRCQANRLTCLSWDSWAPVLVRMAGVSCHSFFPEVPPSFCKGHEGVTCLLEVSEHPSGKKILWGDIRKLHSLEEVEPPHFSGLFGKRGETREQLLPKMPLSEQGTLLCNKLAFYVAAGAWWTMKSCFSMASVDERTRKFLVCTEN